ncbi:MAG: hemolysin family protein [Candidatus Omnitrophota bacterium]|nr:hemolysin family protein [Candidatus Omnitrophota bacterium]
MKIIEIIFLIILLAFAAITAASEIAIIAVSKMKLRKRSSEGSKTAKLILTILETPERFFGTILVANNIVDALIASLVTAIIIHLMGERGWVVVLATAIVSFLIIVSEVAAKTLAARNSEKMAFFLARPIKYLITILSPVVRVLEVITNSIVNLIGGKAKAKVSLVTEEELKALIKIGEEEGVLQKDKYKMLTRVFDLSETIVRSVMKPRTDMMTIDINAHIDAILDKVLESGYSRLPVHKDSPDNIIGVINMKDLLNLSVNKGLIVLQDILYPPTFVAGSKKVVDLLKDFQKGHTHIAIVLDAKGAVEGLVTLEDILEEIVGEIEDEYDIRGTAKIKKGQAPLG